MQDTLREPVMLNRMRINTTKDTTHIGKMQVCILTGTV